MITALLPNSDPIECPVKPYWERVLDDADARLLLGEAPFTVPEVSKASSWTTCACGKHDPRIERSAGGYGPLDRALRHSGCYFTMSVKGAYIRFNGGDIRAAGTCVKEARRHLGDIERRAGEILAGE